MRLKMTSILLLVLLGETCFANSTIETSKRCEFGSHLVDATVQLLSSCHGESVKEIGIQGDSIGLLLRTLLYKQNLPVISIDDTNKVAYGSKWGISPCKLQLFTIAATSTSQLQDILDKVKKSPWWNHMASFLIVNWSPESADNDCSNAFEFLWAAWQMDILNANFLCAYKIEKVLIYTFNPYTAKAAKSWKLEDTFSGKNDHPWSMYVKALKKDEDICEELNFDKTADLGGYRILATSQEYDLFWHTNIEKTGLDSFEGLDGMVWKILFQAMKANFELKTYGDTDGIEVVRNVQTKVDDICLISVGQEFYPNGTFTYPHSNTGVGIVTHRAGYRSQLSKINSVIDVSSRYGVCLVLMITIIFLKFFIGRPLMISILDTLRLICNTGLLKVPETTAARFYLGALYLFQITILALYLGQLASLLTKDIEKKNVNTMEDLVDSGYAIYGYTGFAVYFSDPIFEDRFVPQNEEFCLKDVMRNRSVACVAEWNLLTSRRIPSEMFLSNNMFFMGLLAYMIREDWPLEKRVNELLGRMMAADIIRRTYTMHSEKIASINKYNQEMIDNKGPEVMTLGHLSFAFAILGIGLGCATVAFIVEIIVDSMCRRK